MDCVGPNRYCTDNARRKIWNVETLYTLASTPKPFCMKIRPNGVSLLHREGRVARIAARSPLGASPRGCAVGV
jgi:hypothetical protein